MLCLNILLSALHLLSESEVSANFLSCNSYFCFTLDMIYLLLSGFSSLDENFIWFWTYIYIELPKLFFTRLDENFNEILVTLDDFLLLLLYKWRSCLEGWLFLVVLLHVICNYSHRAVVQFIFVSCFFFIYYVESENIQLQCFWMFEILEIT